MVKQNLIGVPIVLVMCMKDNQMKHQRLRSDEGLA